MSGRANDRVAAYLNQVANDLVTYFDVYREDSLEEIPLAFRALHKRRDERYLITRSARVWRVENRQQILAAALPDSAEEEFFYRFCRLLNSRVNKYAPSAEHMSTLFLGVLVKDGTVVEALRRKVLKYRKLKFYRFGFRGWAETYMALIDLQRGNMTVHPKGRPFLQPFGMRLHQMRA